MRKQEGLEVTTSPLEGGNSTKFVVSFQATILLNLEGGLFQEPHLFVQARGLAGPEFVALAQLRAPSGR